ncbi:MAG: hypothetical protein H0T86_06850 [Gemmatimonadales bacterium]|nr:hypothetical protein [Gemmatimonadales bacterium]
MNLVDRVKRILLSPQPEWQVIDDEVTSPGALYTGYIVPLAAIGPLASVIGYSVFGVRMPRHGAIAGPRRGAGSSGSCRMPWLPISEGPGRS